MNRQMPNALLSIALFSNKLSKASRRTTLRALLMSGVAIAVTHSAFAAGGAGGAGYRGTAGGAGGTGYVGNPGNPGASSTDGGGGGGAGSGIGGAGGGSGASAGGSGGSGGYNGSTAATINNPGGASIYGGYGINGNAGSGSSHLPAGGGGGAGGYGGIATGPGNNSNAGYIYGGSGGNGGYSRSSHSGNGGDGGIGFLQTTGTLFDNSGTVKGGDGGNGGNSRAYPGIGGAGGIGASLAGGSVLINSHYIYGGTGGSAGSGGVNTAAGIGGIAVSIGAASTITNSGYIDGGTGGTGSASGDPGTPGGIGGNGGTGISAGAGTTIHNTSTGYIYGGNGASSRSNSVAGVGGAGIVGSALTIDNEGVIQGGQSGASPSGVFQAYAIRLIGGQNFVGGTGTITGGISVEGNSSFQPSLSTAVVGTPLAITGPLIFANTSTYSIRITPTSSDSVILSSGQQVGSATLNGAKVMVQAGSGTYKTQRYTILTAAGGVVGTFSSVQSNLAFLLPTLTYDANNVFLNIKVASPTAFGTPDYRPAARTYNQYQVASGFTAAGPSTGNGARVLTALNQLTQAQAQAAFDATSGEGITATQNLAFREAQMFNDSIFDQTTFYGAGTSNQIVLSDAPPAFTAYSPLSNDRVRLTAPPIHELADLPESHIAPTFVAPNRTWRAWGSGFGAAEIIHGNETIGSATQNNTIYGGAVGVDYQLTPNYLIGVAVGGSDGDFEVPSRTTSGSTTGGHIAIYDLATFGSFYGASSSSFSYYTNRTTRSVSPFGGLASETERGDFASHEFRTRIEFGRHFSHLFGFTALGTVTPFVALEIAELRSNGFSETSVSGPGLLRLGISGQSDADVPSYVGLRFQSVMPFGGLSLRPTMQLAYVHEFAPNRSQIGAVADLPGSTFLVDGARPARDAAQVKVGGEVKIGQSSFLFANFDGEFSRVNDLYAGKGGFKYLW